MSRELTGDVTGPSVDPIAQRFVPFEGTNDSEACLLGGK